MRALPSVICSTHIAGVAGDAATDNLRVQVSVTASVRLRCLRFSVLNPLPPYSLVRRVIEAELPRSNFLPFELRPYPEAR
jgi:hypothetical protein